MELLKNTNTRVGSSPSCGLRLRLLSQVQAFKPAGFKTHSRREADFSALQVTQTTRTLVFQIEGEAGKEPKKKSVQY